MPGRMSNVLITSNVIFVKAIAFMTIAMSHGSLVLLAKVAGFEILLALMADEVVSGIVFIQRHLMNEKSITARTVTVGFNRLMRFKTILSWKMTITRRTGGHRGRRIRRRVGNGQTYRKKTGLRE